MSRAELSERQTTETAHGDFVWLPTLGSGYFVTYVQFIDGHNVYRTYTLGENETSHHLKSMNRPEH